ncbi:C1 family peptidase [Spirosoma endophyticum]|uniref:Papain family cysteine protease n=1 Tax=Spirosoma endophyticum TaxID=662367 RepID=A0A1I1MV79_9BACT|nr:C1 family peptidase [Spirosoma endophyticum]SFC87118.1 Papain family cysteine protease [Spirosoma endophyticum]
MKINPLLLLSLLLLTYCLHAQPRGSGLDYDPKKVTKQASKPLLIKGDYANLPASVSFEQYAPTTGDQGAYMTGVAFATSYHMRTMIAAIQGGITNTQQITQMVFSPSYIYEQLKYESGMDCKSKINAFDALDLVKEKGVATLKTVPYQCGIKISTNADDEAANYRIADYQTLFKADETNAYVKIQTVKKALSEGFPVLMAAYCPPSFYNLGKKGVWEPAPAEKPADSMDKNMMVVVGYDDKKLKDGAFRVLNSWGSKWGDRGFCWVKYADWANYVLFAIQVYPTPKGQSAAATESTVEPVGPVALQGKVSFQTIDNMVMPAGRLLLRNLEVDNGGTKKAEPSPSPAPGEDLVAYRMKNAYSSGTRFRMLVNNAFPAYVYAFATDLSGEVHKILPASDDVSPLLGKNNTVAFPSESGAIRMDNNPGKDYLLILYSQKPLDASTLLAKMSQTSGGLSAKIRAALGNELMPARYISYTPDDVGFAVNAQAKGSVVPLMVEITHR